MILFHNDNNKYYTKVFYAFPFITFININEVIALMCLTKRQKLIKQLYYRAIHRGCKENDIILGNFCSQYLDLLDNQELLDFSNILDCNDNDIFNWVSQKYSAPQHLNPKLIKILIEL